MVLIPTMIAAFDATRERMAATLDSFDQYMTRTDATPTIDMEKVAAFSSAANPSTKKSVPASGHQNTSTPNIPSGSVQAGDSNSANPYASCFRQETGKSSWSLGVTVAAASISLGKGVPMEDDEACIKLVDKIIADNRLARSGIAGQAGVIRRDLEDEANADLRIAVEANRQMIQQSAPAPAGTAKAGQTPLWNEGPK